MKYFLLKTQPEEKSNWVQPSILPEKHGKTAQNEWWFASTTRKEILQVQKRLILENSKSIPHIQVSLIQVEELPN